jgi:hypothetical protein
MATQRKKAIPRKKVGIQKRRKAYQRNRPNAKLHYEGAVLVSVPESTRITGLGLSLSYRWAREGKLPVVQIGGRWFVHVPKLRAMLDGLAGGKADKNAA